MITQSQLSHTVTRINARPQNSYSEYKRMDGAHTLGTTKNFGPFAGSAAKQSSPAVPWNKSPRPARRTNIPGKLPHQPARLLQTLTTGAQCRLSTHSQASCSSSSGCALPPAAPSPAAPAAAAAAAAPTDPHLVPQCVACRAPGNLPRQPVKLLHTPTDAGQCQLKDSLAGVQKQQLWLCPAAWHTLPCCSCCCCRSYESWLIPTQYHSVRLCMPGTR
jgi:hypothetical protein